MLASATYTSRLKHLVGVDDLNLQALTELSAVADYIKKAYNHKQRRDGSAQWFPFQKVLEGLVVGVPFFEPSTRTNWSFRSAVEKLGGGHINTDNAGVISSAAKGEGVAKAAEMYGLYADLLVQRHPDNNAGVLAASASNVPFINAGSGHEEHPTQALLDIYTIWEKFGGKKGLNLTVVGDLKFGRTVHSLLKLIARFSGTEFSPFGRCVLVSPESLKLPDELVDLLEKNGIVVEIRDDLSSDIVRRTDVIYMTRTQKERAGRWHKFLYKFDSYLKSYDFIGLLPHEIILTEVLARQLPEWALILHPLPKGKFELPDEVDLLPQAYYTQQAKNGLFVRMALLIYFLKPEVFEELYLLTQLLKPSG